MQPLSPKSIEMIQTVKLCTIINRRGGAAKITPLLINVLIVSNLDNILNCSEYIFNVLTMNWL